MKTNKQQGEKRDHCRLMAQTTISALLGAAFSRNKCHKVALKEIGCYDNDTCNIAEIIKGEIIS